MIVHQTRHAPVIPDKFLRMNEAKARMALHMGDLGAAIAFAAALPADYQPPSPRKEREIRGTWDIGLHRSYRDPNATCDVTAILKRYNYDDPKGWKEYCDCRFPAGTPFHTKCLQNFCAWPGGCKNDAVPGNFMMPFNVNPAAGSPPWEDAGVGARGLPKEGAGFMADLGALMQVNPEDYEPLKLWKMFWENPSQYNLLTGKLIFVLPGIGLIVNAILRAPLGIPIALLPFALEQCRKDGKNPKVEIWDPIGPALLRHAELILKYLGKCGIGINVPCAAGLIVQRAAEDQIRTGEINNVRDDTLKSIITFLANSGEKLVDAVMGAIGGKIEASNVFQIFSEGFKAVADVVTDAGTKKIMMALSEVAAVIDIIATGIRNKLPFKQIADNVCERILGFRPSIYFDLIFKDKAQAGLDYAQSGLSRVVATVSDIIERLNAVGTFLDKLIAGLQQLSTKFGGALDELVAIFSGAKNTIMAPVQEATTLANQISDNTKIALAKTGQLQAAWANALQKTAGTTGVLPSNIPTVRPGSVSPAVAAIAAGRKAANLTVAPVSVPVATFVPPAVVRPVQPVQPVRPPVVDIVPVQPAPPPSPMQVRTPLVPQQQETPMNFLPFIGGAAGFLVGGPVGAAAGAAAGFALGGSKPKTPALRGFGLAIQQQNRLNLTPDTGGKTSSENAGTPVVVDTPAVTTTSAQPKDAVVILTPQGPAVYDPRPFPRGAYRPGVPTVVRPPIVRPAKTGIAPPPKVQEDGPKRGEALVVGGTTIGRPVIVGQEPGVRDIQTPSGPVSVAVTDPVAETPPKPILIQGGAPAGSEVVVKADGDVPGVVREGGFLVFPEMDLTDPNTPPSNPPGKSNTTLMLGLAVAAVGLFAYMNSQKSQPALAA